MSEWYASVNYGLDKLASEVIRSKGAKNISVLGSAVLFRHDREIDCTCINNLFFVLSKFLSHDIEQAANIICSKRYNWSALRGRTFRIICMDNGKLIGVPPHIMSRLEREISYQTKLKPYRANPDTEIWINHMNDNRTFFMIRTKKHTPFNKTLRKGELRPDIVEIMLYTAKLNKTDIVLDPFGGSGAVAFALLNGKKCKAVYTGDIDNDCVAYMRERIGNRQNCIINQWDALRIPLADNSIDVIITDPPWGHYKEVSENFLDLFIQEAIRLLKNNGKLIFLSSSLDSTELSLKNNNLTYDIFDLIINGKNAYIFVAKKTETEIETERIFL